MSEIPASFAVPEPEEVLSGAKTLKPLQHDAAALRAFVAAFDDVALLPDAAESLANLAHHLQDAPWAQAHDAAHHALQSAYRMTHDEAQPALLQDGLTIDGVLKSPLPNARSLKMIQHHELQEMLAPVGPYLENFSAFLKEWRPLGARFMQPQEGEGLTPNEYKTLHPTPTKIFPPEMPEPAAAHVHGPDCNHAPDDRTVAGFSEALPKGKAVTWAWVSLGIGAAHAFFITLLGKHNGLSAKEKECADSPQMQAASAAYIVKHGISCGLTDIALQPLVAAAFGVNIGCTHAGHDHAGHAHAPQKLTLASFAREAVHYFKGEIFGDFVAVPLTIGVQRVFPDFMRGLRKIVEPALGWAFRLGANHSAKQWGREQGFAAGSAEVKARADVLYEHEMSHIGQAVVWNMLAYPIGAIGQKAMGHGKRYSDIFKSKLVGALISNGILIGSRLVAPGAAQKSDDVMGEKLFLPVNNAISKLFGVDEKAMEETITPTGQTHWEDRIRATQPLALETKAL